MGGITPKKNRRVRKKHVPQRTCVGCREVNPKRELIRLVRLENGIVIDPTGKQPGRGAYLHNQMSCWEKALSGSLAQALRRELSQADIETLKTYVRNLSNEDEAE